MVDAWRSFYVLGAVFLNFRPVNGWLARPARAKTLEFTYTYIRAGHHEAQSVFFKLGYLCLNTLIVCIDSARFMQL